MALVTKSFSDIITFTRASTATYFNSAGVLTSAAINAPRFDYNPVTLAARGLLIEEQRTNLTLQSEDFATTWTVGPGVTVSTNATTAPSGTTTADKLQEDATTGSHLVTQPITFTAATHTASVFAKKAERDWIRVLFFDGTNTFSGFFNLTAGTVGTLTGTGTTATIAAVGNGWYRCTVTATTAAGSGSFAPRIALADGNSSYTGVTGNGVFIWGAQLEAGAFPTSYIPTTTTALTRSADVASVNTLSPWFNQPEGGLYVEWQSAPTLYARYLVSIEQAGTSATRIDININSVNAVNPRTVVGGAAVASLTGGTYTGGGIAKIAFGYKSADYASSFNGAAAVTATTAGALPSSLATMYLGSITGGTQVNGWLRRFTYYPRRPSNAELVALSA